MTLRTVLRLALVAAALSLGIARAAPISTYAGGGVGDGPALQAPLLGLMGMVREPSGTILFADSAAHRVRRLDLAAGTIATVMGTGVPTSDGDGGPLSQATFNAPVALARDAAGNLYVAESSGLRVRRITPAGAVSTVAGNGFYGDSGDGGPASNAQFRAPVALAVDSAGNLFIADQGSHKIRRVDAATGTITTYAGTGASASSGDGGLATAAGVYGPGALAVDAADNLIIADTFGNRVRKVTAKTGVISLVAGNGTPALSGDGEFAVNASLSNPYGLAFDAAGNLYIGDNGNARVRRVAAATGVITTFAGSTHGYGGDGGPATSAGLESTYSVLVAGTDVFIADGADGRIRKVNGAGTMSTVAGNGTPLYYGDGGPATAAVMGGPGGVAWLGTGLAIADTYENRVRFVNHATGAISTIAGDGSMGMAAEGADPALSPIYTPGGMARHPVNGDLYVAESGNHRVRRITLPSGGNPGTIVTVAGGGFVLGDGGPATSARLQYPVGVAFDPAGNLYILDGGQSRIRKVNGAGTITTIVGTGTPGWNGDGLAGTATQVSAPGGIAADASGNVYFADTNNQRIRKLDALTGLVSTLAGSGSFGFGADNVAATTSAFANPRGLAIDGANLLIVDEQSNRIRSVPLVGGNITAFAGMLATGSFGGDGGPATSARLRQPYAVATGTGGDVFIADTLNNRVRRVGKLAQSIAFAQPANRVLSQGSLTVSATASSGLPVTFSSLTTLVCLVSGDTVTFPTPQLFGTTCTIRATQAGDADYAAATLDRTFSVGEGVVVSVVGEGAQVVPASGVTATVPGTVVIDTTTRLVSWSFDLSGVPGTFAAASFRGAAARGANASVKIDATASPASGSATYLLQDEADLLAGRWYYRYDTAEHPAGAVRAQLDTLGSALADNDGDGIPNGVEVAEGRNPLVKDNDIFSAGATSARLFAMQQYRDFLSREGDAAGITAWTDLIVAGTYTRPQVIDAFLGSPEFAGVIAPVVRLYFATFLRVPDYSGLSYNAGLVRSGAVTVQQLADFFTASPEFAATYGALDNTQFVTLLYNNVLGRAPDQAGLDGWVALLGGGMSRGQVLLGFSDSPEYQAAMDNEVFVTMMYAGMLRRTPETAGFSGWVSALDAGSWSRTQVIDGFLQSAEYHARFLP